MAQDLWFFLNHQITLGIDVFGIAKKNKLIPKGYTKDPYKVRPGILMDHLSSEINKNTSLKELFTSKP